MIKYLSIIAFAVTACAPGEFAPAAGVALDVGCAATRPARFVTVAEAEASPPTQRVDIVDAETIETIMTVVRAACTVREVASLGLLDPERIEIDRVCVLTRGLTYADPGDPFAAAHAKVCM